MIDGLNLFWILRAYPKIQLDMQIRAITTTWQRSPTNNKYQFHVLSTIRQRLGYPLISINTQSNPHQNVF
jgi:hypothetical protein